MGWAEAKSLKSSGFISQISRPKTGGNKGSGTAKTAGQVKNHPSQSWVENWEERGQHRDWLGARYHLSHPCAIKAKYLMKNPPVVGSDNQFGAGGKCAFFFMRSKSHGRDLAAPKHQGEARRREAAASVQNHPCSPHTSLSFLSSALKTPSSGNSEGGRPLPGTQSVYPLSIRG